MIKRIIAKLRQLHKRKAFVLLGLSCIVISTALMITFLASYRLDRIAGSRQVTFTIERNASSRSIMGSGVNISSIPDSNILTDSSFEPYSFREAMRVAGGSDSIIVVENADARPGVYGEGFFEGATARINTFTGAQAFHKKTAVVLRYSPNVAREFISVPIEGDIPNNAGVNSIAVKSGQVIAAGDKGIVINNANTQSPEVEFIGVSDNLVSAVANNKEFFALSETGLVFSSEDGSSWKRWISPGNFSANAIAASDRAIVVAGEKGRILVGQDGSLYRKETGSIGDINDIIFDGRKFIGITSEGEIISSGNGIFWETVIRNSQREFLKIAYADEVYTVICKEGTAYVYSDIRSEPVSVNAFDKSVHDISVVSRSKIFVLTEEGGLYETVNLGIDWTESLYSAPEGTDRIFSVAGIQIICTSDFFNIYTSDLVTEIELDSGLVDEQDYFKPGDICYLSIEFTQIPESLLDDSIIKIERSWQFYGQGNASLSFHQGPVGGGAGVMELVNESAENDSYAIVSQKIAPGMRALEPGNFYYVSMWIRQSEIGNSPVKVWISGPFDPIGTEFRNIGTGWKKYTFRFSFPPSITRTQALQARFNIGTGSNNSIFIDKVRLTEVADQDYSVKSDFREMISFISPSIVRLDFFEIGSLNTMPNRWASDGSLENALELIWGINENAHPWVVFDSAISESELRNFMEYMCAPISTAYGRKRLESGHAIPWINRFERIYFEFTDTNNLFANDAIKSNYVNKLIEIVQNTPYFSDNRGKIIFVDGLYYSDGIMLSRADYNASDLSANLFSDIPDSIENALSEYRSIMPRTPERPVFSPYNLLRSVDLVDSSGNISTAAYLVVMLELLGTDSAASLADIQYNSAQNVSMSKKQALRIASFAARGESISMEASSETYTDINLRGYAFKSGNELTLLFASLSDSPSSVFVNIPNDLKGSIVTKIDSNGYNTEVSSKRSADRRISVLPGQIIMIQINE